MASPPPPSPRDRARAALITLLIAVHTLAALPDASRLDRDAVPGPIAAIADALDRARALALAPARPLLRLTGTGQAWAMFNTPDRHPDRLELHARVDGVWRPVFVRHQLEPPAFAAVLRDRRVRALYDGAPDEGSVPFWNFSRAMAAAALLAVPEADVARVRLIEREITVPPAAPATAERVRLERTHKRTSVLPEDGLL